MELDLSATRIEGAVYYDLQDTFVRYVFATEPTSWFTKKFSTDTWVLWWDNSHRGFVDYDTMVALNKRIGVLGPTAAIFGREFEDYLINEDEAETISVERMERSIRHSLGALSKETINPANQASYGRGQSSSSTSWKVKTV